MLIVEYDDNTEVRNHKALLIKIRSRPAGVWMIMDNRL